MAARRYTFTVDSRKVQGALKRAPALMLRECRNGLRRIGRDFTTRMITARFRGYDGTSGGAIQNRSGLLRRSFGHEVDGKKLEDLKLRVFSAGVKYANLQEYGGTIRPKPPRKYLTIPLPENLTGAGVPRYPSAASLRHDPREEGGTFIFKSKKGNLLIAQKLSRKLGATVLSGRGKDAKVKRVKYKEGDIRLLWVLKRSVKIEGRLGFRSTWAGQSGYRRRTLGAALDSAIKEATQG